MIKTCSKCEVEQPKTNFSQGNAPDGFRYDCKSCAKVQDAAYNATHKKEKAAYRAAHTKEKAAYNAIYRGAHTESQAAYNAVYKDANKEDIRKYAAVYNAAYAVAHKELKKAYDAAYRVANSESIAAYNLAHRESQAAYSAAYNDAHKKESAAYRKAHKEANTMHIQTRRSRKAGLPSTLTASQWKTILKEFNNTCAYCGSPDKALHQEHYLALSKGGSYEATNIICACGSCNSSKGAKDFFTWYPTFKHYSKERETKIMKFLHFAGESQLKVHNELALGEQIEMAEQASVEESK